MSDGRFVLLICAAHALSVLGIAAYPAFLPTFIADWQLSNTEAGWIGGLFYGGYMAAVPMLVSLTDRIDVRRVYLASTALTAVGGLGFALFADGFWSACLFRLLAGAGMAGTYMPGLKALSDRLAGRPDPSRAIAYYTATFGLGLALSYFLAGEIGAAFGWRWAFVLGGVGGIAAGLVAAATIAPEPARRRPAARLLDFRPVLRNRGAMAYVLAYAAHMWELFALREWMVAFLSFSLTLQATAAANGGWARPTSIAALFNLLALPASILGNEASVRFGRKRVVAVVLSVSATLACVVGFTAGGPFPLVAALCVVYGLAATTDAASITAGTVAAADPRFKGATMALHSTIGFGAGFLGPLAVGVVLDATGADTATSWGLAFVTMGAGAALGPVALLALSRRRAAFP